VVARADWPLYYRYYVFGHYPSSCLYLKTVLFIFFKTETRRWIMSKNIIFVLIYHCHKLLDLNDHSTACLGVYRFCCMSVTSKSHPKIMVMFSTVIMPEGKACHLFIEGYIVLLPLYLKREWTVSAYLSLLSFSHHLPCLAFSSL
jgi:hypothetical protein